MIVYAGNLLSKHGKSVTMIELLGPRLAEHYPVVLTSIKENKILRLLDMVYTLVKNRPRTKLILIDCYSSQAFWFVVVMSFFSQLFKIPYIPILHGGDLPNRLKRSDKISRYVFGRSAINVSPSKYLLSVFSNAGYDVVYIPNFIELSNYKFKARTELNPRLLWVRSFHSIYNPEMAIEVLVKLQTLFKDASLAMVGPDKDGCMERCQLLIERHGLNSSVMIVGYLQKVEWLALSEQYDIFINTTNFDNMPVSVIEAMALGLPIVSTNAGGLPYLIDNGVDGILKSKGDVDGFVDGIEQLLKNEEYSQRIISSARKKAEKLDWSVVRDQWIELINRESKSC